MHLDKLRLCADSPYPLRRTDSALLGDACGGRSIKWLGRNVYLSAGNALYVSTLLYFGGGVTLLVAVARDTSACHYSYVLRLHLLFFVHEVVSGLPAPLRLLHDSGDRSGKARAGYLLAHNVHRGHTVTLVNAHLIDFAYVDGHCVVVHLALLHYLIHLHRILTQGLGDVCNVTCQSHWSIQGVHADYCVRSIAVTRDEAQASALQVALLDVRGQGLQPVFHLQFFLMAGVYRWRGGTRTALLVMSSGALLVLVLPDDSSGPLHPALVAVGLVVSHQVLLYSALAVLARWPLEVRRGQIEKHKDKQGSTAHHQKGGAGGVAAPPPGSVPQDDMQMEDRVQTLTADIKERNAKGASLRLSPGYRNAPYAVTGMDALNRPVRFLGNVADITQALRENSAEVDEIMAQRKVDNYAVPIDVGKVNEVQIYEGDGVSPMEMVREQVARASFSAAVATVMKQPKRGWQARDYLIDDKQQVEPENVSVMGGVRTPGNRNQEGHATTEIEQGGDVEGISGTKINIPTEPLDTPPAAGIAQQGAISPPQGIQGVGAKPKFIQVHDDQPMHGVREENEGTGLDPQADADNRGAPVAHKTQRP